MLTQGSGGVSVFALQFARILGARVIATTSTAEKAERLKAIGASDVINYSETPNWDAKARELTDGRGVDCVVESASGNIAVSTGSFRVADCVHYLVPGLRSSGRAGPAETAARPGAKTPVLDWRNRLVCSRCGGRQADIAVSGTKWSP